ncbi:Protein roadkill [Cyphomyrmex costatus]|uniref:Protein roadkill n=1 Tax=Cyphomyrmex costatus TaxID=456900 RepID=A0A195C7H5_9HYME|nr:Protein roadkill [Cyphomyrmex costatus]
MAVSRVPSPPPPEVNTPVAENWCYTQEIHPVTVSGGNC